MNIIKSLFCNLSNDHKASLRVIRSSFWKINWIKTLWFNFKIQPFNKALKCPVIIAYNTKIKNIGKIIFTDEIYTGMVSFGVMRLPSFETTTIPLIFNNRGTMKIGGRFKVHPGSVISIVNNATFIVGNHVGIGANSKVICHKLINIGSEVRISWNCQLFDSDFHFLYNINKDKYYPRTKEIVIGNNIFIGNGCTIGKGTIIPNGSVVSCISKVSGDYSKEGENLLIAGNPGIVLTKGFNITSGWLPEEEEKVAKRFE